MRAKKGSVMALPAGTVLRVEHGALWLTQYPDPKDYFLSAGESMRLARKGSAVVSALRDADFRVIASEEIGWRAFLTSVALRLRPV